MSVQWTEQTGQLRSRYNSGFDAYCAGLSIADLSDPIEQRGWWAANRAQGYAEMPVAELGKQLGLEIRLDDAIRRTQARIDANRTLLADLT